jgi:hypothetical protein
MMVEQVNSIDFRARKVKRLAKAPAEVPQEVLSILDACIYWDVSVCETTSKRNAADMKSLVGRFERAVKGVLTGFDRIVS